MTPYANNNFYNPYPQYQQQYPTFQNNPYAERINNLQQYQQSLQPQQVQPQNTLGGKVVDSIDAVKATDIPMDGNLYYFPKADGSELYAKHWLTNGTTEIITYRPFVGSESTQNSQAVNSSQNEEKSNTEAFTAFAEAFMKRFDDIEGRFDKLEKSIKGRSATSRAKKEDDAE